MVYRVQGFVDGGYVRRLADEATGGGEKIWPEPAALVRWAANTSVVGSWLPTRRGHRKGTHVQRTTYYDGRPDDDSDVRPELREYWDLIDGLDDTQLGFGMVRGEKPPRQKAVDTLLATDLPQNRRSPLGARHPGPPRSRQQAPAAPG